MTNPDGHHTHTPPTAADIPYTDHTTVAQALDDLHARVAALEDGTQPPPTGTPSEGLFFDATPIQQPGTHTHLSFPHWWPYTIRSWHNSATEDADWYSTAMNNPDHKDFASSKKWGGDSRVRPLFRPPIDGDYELADRRFDIDTAIDYGHDGFLADIINTWKPRIDQLAQALRQARDENPDRYGSFVVIPMIDANSGGVWSTPQTAGEYLQTFADVTKWVTIDGVNTMLWAVWHPGTSAATPADWTAIHDWLADHDTPNRMIGCWNSSYTDTKKGPSAHAAITIAEGPWAAGNADPVNIQAATPTIAGYCQQAHQRGKKFLHPARPAETRPSSKGPWWDEAVNTQALAAQWEQIIDSDSDWCQPVTWSDWTEDTSYAPGTHYGHARLLLSAWYLHIWKTGQEPKILRDAVILSHRQHRLGADVTYPGETSVLPQRGAGGSVSDPSDLVEARVWLTAPADIRFTDADGTISRQLPAGMHVAAKDLAVGVAPRVEIWRNGQLVTAVQSTRTVDAAPWRTDWTYWQFTSLHDTTWQQRIPGPNPPYA